MTPSSCFQVKLTKMGDGLGFANLTEWNSGQFPPLKRVLLSGSVLLSLEVKFDHRTPLHAVKGETQG